MCRQAFFVELPGACPLSVLQGQGWATVILLVLPTRAVHNSVLNPRVRWCSVTHPPSLCQSGAVLFFKVVQGLDETTAPVTHQSLSGGNCYPLMRAHESPLFLHVPTTFNLLI